MTWLYWLGGFLALCVAVLILAALGIRRDLQREMQDVNDLHSG